MNRLQVQTPHRLEVLNSDTADILRALKGYVVDGATVASMSAQEHAQRGQTLSGIWSAERERLIPVMNVGSDNAIDPALKRVLCLNENVRDFAKRLLPLRLFSTVFQNTPLQGTDTIAVPYYPLQSVASSTRTTGNVPSYVFGQGTTTNKALITVNRIKYQPIDYSSYEFRRQPFFNATQLGRMNAEKLAADIMSDILSVVTADNFGDAVKTTVATAFGSDDVVDIRGAANALNWPDVGRSLIVDSTVDNALQKDAAYKLALNIGTASVIQQGQFPTLSGFQYSWLPNLPDNGENLIGFAAFASGILAAFAPIDPAPGVRQQLVGYEVVTDAATGISFNYRAWGDPMNDRQYEVVEAAYGFSKGVSNAVLRIVSA